MSEDLKSVLPESDPFATKPWGSCAIVGNSGKLLTHTHGKEIDSHDTVIRFNAAPTRNFEAHVGSKTTIRQDRYLTVVPVQYWMLSRVSGVMPHEAALLSGLDTQSDVQLPPTGCRMWTTLDSGSVQVISILFSALDLKRIYLVSIRTARDMKVDPSLHSIQSSGATYGIGWTTGS